MRLSPDISGRCQLILIPGEYRKLELAGVGAHEGFDAYEGFDAHVELFAEPELVSLAIECASPGPDGAQLVIAVPTDIDTSKPWSARVRVAGEIFCECEVKFLDARRAKELGWAS